MKVLLAIEDTCQDILDFVFQHKWSADTEFIIVKVIEPLMVGHVHSVLPSPVIYDMMDDLRKQAAEQVRHVALKMRDKYHSVNISEMVEEGLAASTIVDLARSKKVDLIILSTHARHGVERFFFGSISHDVAANAPCEVLIVHPQKSAKQQVSTRETGFAASVKP